MTATVARVLSDKNNECRLMKSVSWAENELSYIEDRIRRAIEKGQYVTDYWWSKELLAENGLTQRDAKEGLQKVLTELGYRTEYSFNYGNDKVFKIYINWEKMK